MLLNLDLEIERENAAERVEKLGPGAELVRSLELEEFDLHVGAFRAHASLPDLAALNRAFRYREHSNGLNGGATFVEAILVVLGESQSQHSGR